jgi:hypothetical protein
VETPLETVNLRVARVRQNRNYLGIVSSSIDRLVLICLHVTRLRARSWFSFIGRIEPTGSYHRMGQLDMELKIC